MEDIGGGWVVPSDSHLHIDVTDSTGFTGCSCNIRRYAPPSDHYEPASWHQKATVTVDDGTYSNERKESADNPAKPEKHDGLPRRPKKKRSHRQLNEGELQLAKRHKSFRDELESTTSALVNRHASVLNPSPTSTWQSQFDNVGNSIDFASACRKTAKQPPQHELVLSELNSAKPLNTTDVVNRFVRSSSTTATELKIEKSVFILPPDSRFLCSDLIVARKILPDTKYDLIVLDPPWPNKSAQRGVKYRVMQVDDFFNLPVARLVKQGTLVACWVTNNVGFIERLKHELFPAWGLQVVGEWHWVKVTKSGNMVGDLDSTHKKPYEPLILGRCGDPPCGIVEVKKNDTIISVPSKQHSRKPVLTDVLRDHCSLQPRCLEMFARNLLPEWTSWGNEVIKHQQVGREGLQRCDDGCPKCAVK